MSPIAIFRFCTTKCGVQSHDNVFHYLVCVPVYIWYFFLYRKLWCWRTTNLWKFPADILITVLNRHPRYCYCWFSFTEEEKYPGGFDFHLTLFYMFTKYVHVLYTSSPRLEIELTLPWSPPPQSSFPYTINLVMFKSTHKRCSSLKKISNQHNTRSQEEKRTR